MKSEIIINLNKPVRLKAIQTMGMTLGFKHQSSIDSVCSMVRGKVFIKPHYIVGAAHKPFNKISVYVNTNTPLEVPEELSDAVREISGYFKWDTFNILVEIDYWNGDSINSAIYGLSPELITVTVSEFMEKSSNTYTLPINVVGSNTAKE